MKQVLNFVLVVLISISSKAQFSKGNLPYKMKDVTIPTRWTKEVGPKNALLEYPRPQLEREQWTNLNGLWDYAITEKTAEKVVQFDGRILVPFPLESALSGVKKNLLPIQALWYRRMFDKPTLKSGERLLLNFGAVSWEATIYINGKKANVHTGSYTSFAIDITEYLVKGINEITVKSWNPLERGIGPRGKQTLTPNSMWYTPSSGIWQTVWLETVPANYIKSIKVTPDVDRGELNLVVNGSGNAPVEVKVLDGKRVITTLSGLQPSLPGGERNVAIKIPNAKLWSPDSPHLYDLEITMGKDKVRSYFGMRKVEIKKDEKGIDRIFLNNKYTYNLGVLDQGFWPDGLYAAPTDEALKFDIEAIKTMGFNTIRKHIKVEPARWYYHADKLGMLVWQDFVQPAVPLIDAGKKQFEKESGDILTQLNNSPCITTWVLFNEGWGDYDSDRLTKWIKKNDPTRLINGHSGSMIVNGKLKPESIAEVVRKSIGSDMTDIHSYPNPAIPNHISGKAMVLGEFGGIGVQVQGHLWNDLAYIYSYGKTIGNIEMCKIYSQMVASLVDLEVKGLSASIYTQPFDVENEQNGLITYDREIVKVPVNELRIIHSKILKGIEIQKSNDVNLEVKDADPIKTDFTLALEKYKKGKIDSASLRALIILAASKNDVDTKEGRVFMNQFVKSIRNPFSEENLKFIKRFTRNTIDTGFTLFYNNIEKISKVLSRDEINDLITAAIDESELKSIVKVGNPNWSDLEFKYISKYGDFGKESIWTSRLLYAANNKDWKLFEKIFVPWYEKFDSKRLRIRTGLINNLAWDAFEHINNPEFLLAVTKMTQRALIEEPENSMIMDTHANLLYKLGKKQEAIMWEQKAIDLSPNENILKETLEKIQSGTPTWPVVETIK